MPTSTPVPQPLMRPRHARRYVSCSATQGLNLITMARDDAYLAELLHFLRAFWRWVRDEPAPPTADLFWSGPESARYEAFLRRTKELGETTTIEQHVAKPWRRPASKLGQRLFIEGRE